MALCGLFLGLPGSPLFSGFDVKNLADYFTFLQKGEDGFWHLKILPILLEWRMVEIGMKGTLVELSPCTAAWILAFQLENEVPKQIWKDSTVARFLKVPVLYLSGQGHGKERAKAKLKIIPELIHVSTWGGRRCLETKAVPFLTKNCVFGSPSPLPVEGWDPHVVRVQCCVPEDWDC